MMFLEPTLHLRPFKLGLTIPRIGKMPENKTVREQPGPRTAAIPSQLTNPVLPTDGKHKPTLPEAIRDRSSWKGPLKAV